MEAELALEVTEPVQPRAADLVVCEQGCTGRLALGGWYTLVFVARGSVRLHDEGDKGWLLQGQSLLLEPRPPGELVLGTKGEAEYYSLSFYPTQPSPGPQGSSLDIPHFTKVTRPERLTYLLRQYLHQRQRGGVTRHALCNLLVLILREVALSAAVIEQGPRGEQGPEAIASHVDAYIAAHYRESISSTDIATELHYNADYLDRVYRQQRDLSVREAIHTRRIREAGAQLLLQKDRRVSDIARLCGFQDTNYFRRVFKRATKLTPNNYRCFHEPERRVGVPG